MEDQELLKMAEKFGFEYSGILDPRTLEFREDVRGMCNPQACQAYNKRWSCPPAVPELDELTKRLEHYTRGIIVQTVGHREDNFDFEAMIETEETHRKRFTDMTVALRKKIDDLWPMSAGHCMVCKDCTWPDAPCRFPEKMFTSMEALGLYVSKVCQDNNIGYYYGPDAISYTSCWVF